MTIFSDFLWLKMLQNRNSKYFLIFEILDFGGTLGGFRSRDPFQKIRADLFSILTKFSFKRMDFDPFHDHFSFKSHGPPFKATAAKKISIFPRQEQIFGFIPFCSVAWKGYQFWTQGQTARPILGAHTRNSRSQQNQQNWLLFKLARVGIFSGIQFFECLSSNVTSIGH